MFDYYLAPYVALSFVKHLAKVIYEKLDLEKEQYEELKYILLEYKKEHELVMNTECRKEMMQLVRDFLDKEKVKYTVKRIRKAFENAHDNTYDETFQAMEAFIHNLNTMHVRQVQHLKDVA